MDLNNVLEKRESKTKENNTLMLCIVLV